MAKAENERELAFAADPLDRDERLDYNGSIIGDGCGQAYARGRGKVQASTTGLLRGTNFTNGKG